MVIDESWWVITTFAFIGTTILSTLITIALYAFMGQEGRFFFKGKFDGKGIDVIRHEPLSNRLRLIRVKWNGQFFQYGKEMMFFGIEKIINPVSDSQRYFNDVVSRMCTWAGSKRPVLFVTDTMSHLITPDLLALVAKTRKNKEYAEANKNIKAVTGKLKVALKTGRKDVDPEIVTYLETLKPDDLTEFMEDFGGRDTFNAYLTGKRVNELERSKGMELGATAKIVLSIAAIGIVLVIIYMVATGQLQEIVGAVKQ